MTEEEKKILYVPELNPERHYDTNGAFENYIPDIISTPDTRKDKKNTNGREEGINIYYKNYLFLGTLNQ